MVRAIIIVSWFGAFGALHAQESTPVDARAYSSTGVARYGQPQETQYRALFGFGGNAGFNANTPQTFIGNVSY